MPALTEIVTFLESFLWVFPPPPQVRYAPPVTEHVSLHGKSICKNMGVWGCKYYASTKLGGGGHKRRRSHFLVIDDNNAIKSGVFYSLTWGGLGGGVAIFRKTPQLIDLFYCKKIVH